MRVLTLSEEQYIQLMRESRERGAAALQEYLNKHPQWKINSDLANAHRDFRLNLVIND